MPGSCVRPGIQTTGKIKKDKLVVKGSGMKTKKLSKAEVKLQMKSFKEKPGSPKGGKTGKIVKVKANVKKKSKKIKDSAIQLA